MTEVTHERWPGIKVDRIVSLRCDERGDVDRRAKERIDTSVLVALSLVDTLCTLVRETGHGTRCPQAWRLSLVEVLCGDGRHAGNILAVVFCQLALLIQLLQAWVGRATDQKTLFVVPWRTARRGEGTITRVWVPLLLSLLLVPVGLLTGLAMADGRDVGGCALNALVVAAIHVGYELQLPRTIAIAIAAAHPRCLNRWRMRRVEPRWMHRLTLLYITVLLADLERRQRPRDIIDATVVVGSVTPYLCAPFASGSAPRR